MAAALGCSPQDLLDLDLAMFDATAAAVTEKTQREFELRSWTNETELLAVLVELTHANLRSKAKNPNNIDPLHIPRPGEGGTAGEVPVVSGLEHIAMIGGEQ